MRGDGALSHTEPHDEFLELCAASTSGRLTEDEQRRLQQHLAICPACLEVLRQYEAIVAHAIPEIAAADAANDPVPDYRWSIEQAEASLFERISLEEKRQNPKKATRAPQTGQILPIALESTWRNLWSLYVAAVLLFAAVGVSAYYVGSLRSSKAAKVGGSASTVSANSSQLSIEEKLSDVAHEREVAHAEISQRDNVIADLRRHLARQSADALQIRAEQAQLESKLQTSQFEQQNLVEHLAVLEQKLASVQANAQTLQGKLDSLDRQSIHDAERASALDAQVHQLTNTLHNHDAELDQTQELLAHDRDIRELMGARDLYIAEVYDVARTGATQKPYGRVFYTKGKSLIFYAYDLDQQAEAKTASTFQVWGRRGPDWQQALPLGIFYEDNAAKKRWVLKLDDPKRLAQIDAVFVTVEPNGGSRKPSGQPLLFAYLHVDPNHP